MDAKTIESQYKKMLALNYGDIDKLIEQLNKSLKLYENTENPNHPKVKYRITLYTKIIEYGMIQKKDKLLSFMEENGLDEEDMINDIPPAYEI